MNTEQYLIDKYNGLTLNTAQLADIMHMDRKSLLNAISADRFPVPTYKMGKSRVANIVDVATFIDGRGEVA